MTSRKPAPIVFVTCLGVLALSPEVLAQRGDRGHARSAPSAAPSAAPSRSSSSSRPASSSTPVFSAPRASTRSYQPPPASFQQRERPSPAPSPAPRYEPPSQRSQPPPVRYEPAPQRTPPVRYDPPVLRAPSAVPSREVDRGRQPDAPARPVYTPPDRADSGPSVRYYDSAHPASSPVPDRDLSTPTRTRSDGSRTNFSSGDLDASRESTRLPRVYDGSLPSSGPGSRVASPREERADPIPDPIIDLSGAGRRERARVPILVGSTSGQRGGPASTRTSVRMRDPSLADTSSRRRLENGERKGSDEPGWQLPSLPIDRKSILERYRAPKPEAPGSRARKGEDNTPDLSHARRLAALDKSSPPAPESGRAHEAKPGERRWAQLGEKKSDPPTALDGTRRKLAASQPPDPTKGSTIGSTIDHAQRREMAARELKRGTERLKRLEKSDPSRARTIHRQGLAVATATNVGVQVSVNTTFATCGISNFGWFWDPCNHGWNSCGPWTGWCNTWWWSGCSSFWWPTCASNWGFGFWWNHGSFWWNGSSCFNRPFVGFWSYPPVYYSTVVYDSYYPPPAREVVVYEQPVVYAEAQDQKPLAPAAGEGSINVGGDSNGAARGSEKRDESGALGRAAGQYLTQGDAAFHEGRYRDAVHYYATAIEYSPDEGVLYLILADALFATGDYHYAAYALRRAVELDANILDSVVDKRSFYADPKDFDRQLAVLESYVEDHPIDDDARLLLAANYLFGNRPAQAADILESAFSLEIRKSLPGRLLLQRANAIREEKSPK